MIYILIWSFVGCNWLFIIESQSRVDVDNLKCKNTILNVMQCNRYVMGNW